MLQDENFSKYTFGVKVSITRSRMFLRVIKVKHNAVVIPTDLLNTIFS
jgi:hypothetical protein